MRIIAGELRGRSIETPPGRRTRPMLDRVRESLFGTLTAWLPEARVLDLFAGTGSLGLEALSRGATHTRFVEKAAGAQQLLRRNVEHLGLESRAEVVGGDALTSVTWGTRDGTRYDVVFFDPPYPLLDGFEERDRVLRACEELVHDALAPEGIVVFHAPRRALAERDFSRAPRPYDCALRTYGTNALWFLQPAESDE